MKNFENFPTAELLQDLGYLTRQSFHRVCSTVIFDRLRYALSELKMEHCTKNVKNVKCMFIAVMHLATPS